MLHFKNTTENVREAQFSSFVLAIVFVGFCAGKMRSFLTTICRPIVVITWTTKERLVTVSDAAERAVK